MAKPTTKTTGDPRMTLLLVACGALLLALICVSAFAYQWHSENADLKKKNQTLRALTDESTLDSVTEELDSTQQDLYAAQSANEEYQRQIKDYESILTENGLMPTATPATGG
jgi:septal ring factor EnvC (AmiA/AmiB activator)